MSINYILNASTIFGSLKNYWQKQIDVARVSRNVSIPLNVNMSASGVPLKARIYRGQWIADCECAGAAFVDPADQRFFCFSCGNRSNGGNPRPVEFPNNLGEIEKAILDRPVNDMAGITDLERASAAVPAISLEDGSALWREWRPHEKLEDLLMQQVEPIKKWKKAGK